MYKLTVPALAQEQSMCCWHTSAMMVWMYSQTVTHRQGPMNTLIPVYTGNTGLAATPQAFITLANTVGMKPLANQNTYDSDDLESLLKANGPAWAAGYWFGFGHVIVITGIDGGTVYFNDPDQGVRKTGRLDWFNSKLATQIAGCLMSKDPKAY